MNEQMQGVFQTVAHEGTGHQLERRPLEAGRLPRRWRPPAATRLSRRVGHPVASNPATQGSSRTEQSKEITMNEQMQSVVQSVASESTGYRRLHFCPRQAVHLPRWWCPHQAVRLPGWRRPPAAIHLSRRVGHPVAST